MCILIFFFREYILLIGLLRTVAIIGKWSCWENALILADRLTGPMAMQELSDCGLITAFVCASVMYRKMKT